AALSRIADGSHKYIKVKEGDTIIFSSSAIPGNQSSINNTINKLYKSGANVIVNSPLHDTHTSGHASSIELQLMINLCKPKYFMPIHGEFAMLKRHSDLAVETGVKEKNCFILRNGEILTISNKKCEKKGMVPCGFTSIDANKQIIDESIVKERKALADSGIVTITFDIRDNHLVDKPHFNSRGFIYMKESYELINEIETKAMKCANAYLIKHVRFSENKFREYIEAEIAAFIYEKVELKPTIVAIVINIE
ncbi:MAG: ribonuclease J, partial [Bacilli bacterium]|nr:ribonuclease J [Bacilli bacterium]